MIEESANMKKLKERSVLREFWEKVTPIRDTTVKPKEYQEEQRQSEYEKLMQDIFGEA